MPVHIQRELGGGVSQIGLHGFDVVTGGQGADSEAVPEIMEPGIIGNAGPLGDLLEVLHHRTANEILTKVIREDQIERVVPDVACLNPGGLLLLVFVPEGGHAPHIDSLHKNNIEFFQALIQFCAEMCYDFTK